MSVGGVKKYDLVIFGATGFTGRLAAQYASKQYGDSISWAIAGRSASKLEAIKVELASAPDVIVADSADRAALTKMVSQVSVFPSSSPVA